MKQRISLFIVVIIVLCTPLSVMAQTTVVVDVEHFNYLGKTGSNEFVEFLKGELEKHSTSFSVPEKYLTDFKLNTEAEFDSVSNYVHQALHVAWTNTSSAPFPVSSQFATYLGAKTVSVEIKYWTTPASFKQELEYNEKFSTEVVKKIITSNMNEEERMCAILTWMRQYYSRDMYATNTVANDASLLDEHYEAFTEYGTNKNKTGVCQGFAQIFRRLCTKAGLEARLLTGTVDGGSHAWNAVKINNIWRQVDVSFLIDNHEVTYAYITNDFDHMYVPYLWTEASSTWYKPKAA